MISASAQYAVRALVHLAGRGAADSVRVRDIAEAEEIPYPFLAKLIPDLVQGGLLDSFKGPTGGVRLAKPPHKITVADVIASVHGAGALGQCFLGLPECSDEAACPVHEAWKPVRDRMLQGLCGSSLSDLVGTLEKKKARARSHPA